MIPTCRQRAPVPRSFPRWEAGYSASELLVVVAVMALIAATALPQYRVSRMQINVAHRMVIANLRLARASAITKSTHFQVSFLDLNRVQLARMQQVPAGSGNWQVDTSNTQVINLPSGTQVASGLIGTTIEFNSRGFAVNLSTPMRIDTQDIYGVTKSLQVWPSGQVDEL